jgi:pimeloyl-ACP methyl ester carboxylesterase
MTMTDARTQRATSLDGTEIAARVHGEGPPLVLVHGAFADGETAWTTLLPELVDRYSCYSMSVRGHGLSGAAEDVRPERLYEDVACLVESIGEPAPAVGLSSGALLSLGAAQRTDAISAVVAYEPPVFQIADEAMSQQLGATIATVAEQSAAGSPAAGVETFLEVVTNEEELATVIEMGLPGMLAGNVEAQLREMDALFADGPPTASDPDGLAKVQVPLLLLHGTRSMPDPWFLDGIRHVARHVPHAEVRVVEGAGHLAPIVRPAPVAREIEAFLSRVGQPA